MIYILIDESGDIGNPQTPANSTDFSMAACICNSENMDYLSEQVEKLAIRLKMKEIKFSKMSSSQIRTTKSFFSKINIHYISTYAMKSQFHHGINFLQIVLKDLLGQITTPQDEKVKVFFDGSENAFFRKIYEPIIRKRFPGATLRFANSIKKPMIQVADFYAGHRRRIEKK